MLYSLNKEESTIAVSPSDILRLIPLKEIRKVANPAKQYAAVRASVISLLNHVWIPKHRPSSPTLGTTWDYMGLNNVLLWSGLRSRTSDPLEQKDGQMALEGLLLRCRRNLFWDVQKTGTAFLISCFVDEQKNKGFTFFTCGEETFQCRRESVLSTSVQAAWSPHVEWDLWFHYLPRQGCVEIQA